MRPKIQAAATQRACRNGTRVRRWSNRLPKVSWLNEQNRGSAAEVLNSGGGELRHFHNAVAHAGAQLFNPFDSFLL